MTPRDGRTHPTHVRVREGRDQTHAELSGAELPVTHGLCVLPKNQNGLMVDQAQEAVNRSAVLSLRSKLEGTLRTATLGER